MDELGLQPGSEEVHLFLKLLVPDGQGSYIRSLAGAGI